MRIALRFILLFLMLHTSSWASTLTTSWYTQEADKKILINVELFLSSTCPHCHKAEAFFKELEVNTPWLHVTRYIIDKDKAALMRFNDLLMDQKMNDFSVPSVYFCNSRWIGFADAKTTGKDLLSAFKYCKQQIEKKGELSPITVDVLQRKAKANLFDASMVEHPSAVKYITQIALLDAYNPCALFCIGGFFALLFMLNNRKAQILNGSIFILVVGLVHFFQQRFTNSFFEFLYWFRWPAALIGLFIFYFAGQYYRKRPTHHLFILVSVFLALMLQSYQQTCLMNWSYIFEQWLFNQPLSSALVALYTLAYQVMYIVSLIVMLMVYVILLNTKRAAPLKPHLNSIGLLYLLTIGLLLIIYPGALSIVSLSLLVLLAVVISGIILSKRCKKTQKTDL